MVEWEYLVKADPGNRPLFPPMDGDRFEDEIHPKYIDSLTKLAKEVRESLRYLLEFKGKLVHKRQDTIIVAQMQIVQEVLAQNHPQVWLDVKQKMEEKMV